MTCTGAREAEITATTQRGKFLSRRRLARKRRGTLADEERSGSTKVDRFSSQLHIVSSVDNDNNVSIGRTNWTLGTLEDDRNGASPLYARKDTTGTLDRSTDLEGFIVIVTQRLK